MGVAQPNGILSLPVFPCECAPVAQLDRANASGALGREFESLRARQISTTISRLLHSSQEAVTLVCFSA